MLKPRFIALVISVGVMILGAGVVSGQDYPTKPLRIVTAGVGGGTDFEARLIAQEISGPLGQPVIVDNRPSGVIPGQVVSQAPPDGYTLLVSSQTLWTGPLLQNTPYDAVRDFSLITVTEISPLILVVHPSLPVKSVKELIALVKAKPGALNYPSGSTGAAGHLAAELFKSMAGVNIMRIAYSSAGASVTALITGEVQVHFPGGIGVIPHMKTGKLRALAVTSAQPSALFPGLPTISASALPGYEAVGMTAMFAPAKTSGAIISRLNREVVRVLNRADVKEKFLELGTEAVGNSPEQAAATVKTDTAKWSKVIKDAGIRVE